MAHHKRKKAKTLELDACFASLTKLMGAKERFATKLGKREEPD